MVTKREGTCPESHIGLDWEGGGSWKVDGSKGREVLSHLL